MKIYISRPKSGIEAVAEYDMLAKTVTVLKGSHISEKIAYSEKFRGSRSIEKHRALFAENGVVVKDATFKSSSTAANFVTGASTNGLVAWKDEEGRTLKSIIAGQEGING